MHIIYKDKFAHLIIVFGILLGIVSCSSSSDGDASLEVINNDTELEKRYSEPNTTIDIDSTGTNGYKGKRKQKKAKFSLTLTAELQNPTVGAEGIQATSVSIEDNKATVSYNKQGSSYKGGLDVLQVTSGNARSMRIRSSVEFFDADVNAVFAGEDKVWVALATANTDYINGGDRSALQGFELGNFDLEKRDELSVSLPSFAANSVKEYGDRVFITSGSEGGLSVYNRELTEELNYTALSNTRWVDVNENYLVILLGDSNDDGQGELVLLDPESYEVQNRYSFAGVDTPEAKNTVELVEHLAFIAAGAEGVQVMDLTTGNIVAEIPRPDPSELGISDQRVMTNAVSVDEDKIFISNGEAGVYVAEADREISTYEPGQKVNISMLGKLKFDNLESVNHIAYRKKMLVVAAGVGGVKVVRLDAK